MRYITSYNHDWPSQFESIAAPLEAVLPDGCRLHHVGSTSVPGMPAKDIIDIDVECPVGAIDAVIHALREAGYGHEGDRGIPGREAFRPMGGSEASRMPAHHLYACESGAYELKKHLAYRDYLVANGDRAQWLARRKIAVDESAETRSAYIERKAPFYRAITKESLEWTDKPVNRTR